ncbi:MAG: PD-(D/E)XK nuclease family protein [Gammaproteobacteria bacterium]
MRSELMHALEDGATLVTVNRRLARHFHSRFITAMLARGHVVWETPDILPWSTWLVRCWSQILPAGEQDASRVQTLLNSFQEQALWERIISESSEAELLLQVPATAKAAREAWKLLNEWQIQWPFPDSLMNEDTRAFTRWARLYVDRCAVHGWLDTAQLSPILAERLTQEKNPIATHVLLTGFDEFTPQQLELLDALKRCGTEVCEVESAQSAGRAVRTGLADVTAEINAAALWARALFEQGNMTRIGVVVPNLAALRPRIEAIFDDVLLPETVLPRTPVLDRPYNITLGLPLSRYPIIHTALLILELVRGSLPLEKLSVLLRSPHLAGAEEEVARRALLDERLRKLGGLRVPIDVLGRFVGTLDTAGKLQPFACPVLAERLTHWRDALGTLLTRQAPSIWSASFTRLLKALGWPGQRPLNSHEYQTVAAWRELLEDFATLDAVVPSFDLVEAYTRFRGLVSGQVFQPKSPDVPVQVLGTLEAAGLSFDHLWVMGLSDDTFPTMGRPSPFIPIALQRQHGLPHATPEREAEYAQNLISRLITSAERVILSYPQSDGERPLRASALIGHVSELDKPLHSSAGAPNYCARIYGSRWLESLEDFKAPPVPKGERVSGGASLFKDQAACPFRAFAVHRLRANALPTSQVGLDAATRGKLVHRALEYLWAELKSQDQLAKTSGRTLERLVTHAAARAVAAFQAEYPHVITDRFAALEIRRLARLSRKWLCVERERVPFTVVERELQHRISMGGLEIRTQVDRIDRLSDGRTIVIDYKTGKASPDDWVGERPADPQLPLYATEAGEDISAVLFAKLSTGEMRFVGFSREADIVPGVQSFSQTRYSQKYTSWEALFEAWREVLERLGEAFQSGDAQVDPRAYPATCRHCWLGTFCRVNELREQRNVKVREAVSGG